MRPWLEQAQRAALEAARRGHLKAPATKNSAPHEFEQRRSTSLFVCVVFKCISHAHTIYALQLLFISYCLQFVA